MNARAASLMFCVVVIVLMLFTFVGLNSYCSDHPTVNRPNQDKAATNRDAVPSGEKPNTFAVFDNVFPSFIHQSYVVGDTSSSNESIDKWKREFFCHIKVGEFALAWATILLFVATGFLVWMGVRQETMSRTHERAYIFGGGPYGFLKEGVDSTKALAFPQAEFFSDLKRMTLHNYGRTIGYITSVEWGFYPYELFKEGLRVSDIIDREVLARSKVTLKVVPYPGEIVAPSGIKPLLYRQVAFNRSEYVDKVFFGRIRYQDVFGDPHHSTFQLLLRERYSEPLGSQYDDQS